LEEFEDTPQITLAPAAIARMTCSFDWAKTGAY